MEPTKIAIRSENNERHIFGYGALFEKESKPITEHGKTFREVISRGAFDEVLNDPELNCIAVREHDKNQILARTRSGTLNLGVDEIGLWYEFKVPDTQLGRDTYEMVKRGDLDESSFRYTWNEKDIQWSRGADGVLIRRVNKVRGLFDVTICANGAFAGTDVVARNICESDKPELPKADDDFELNSIIRKMEEHEASLNINSQPSTNKTINMNTTRNFKEAIKDSKHLVYTSRTEGSLSNMGNLISTGTETIPFIYSKTLEKIGLKVGRWENASGDLHYNFQNANALVETGE